MEHAAGHDLVHALARQVEQVDAGHARPRQTLDLRERVDRLLMGPHLLVGRGGHREHTRGVRIVAAVVDAQVQDPHLVRAGGAAPRRAAGRPALEVLPEPQRQLARLIHHRGGQLVVQRQLVQSRFDDLGGARVGGVHAPRRGLDQLHLVRILAAAQAQQIGRHVRERGIDALQHGGAEHPLIEADAAGAGQLRREQRRDAVGLVQADGRVGLRLGDAHLVDGGAVVARLAGGQHRAVGADRHGSQREPRGQAAGDVVDMARIGQQQQVQLALRQDGAHPVEAAATPLYGQHGGKSIAAGALAWAGRFRY